MKNGKKRGRGKVEIGNISIHYKFLIITLPNIKLWMYLENCLWIHCITAFQISPNIFDLVKFYFRHM
jgi:hypothetical protein